MFRSKIILFATVGSIPFLSPATAWAAGTTDEQGSLAEIVVTAQKRNENLQAVPVAITVLGQDALANANATQFTDIAKLTPSLNLSGSATPLESTVSVRGIGTYAFGVGIERSVAILIDGVPVTVQSQAFTNLADVAQIEVLRGPQSTLFGKSANAGAILITTRKSSEELTGRIEGMVATDDEQRLTGTISAPLTPTLGFRLTGEWNHFRGTLKNIAKDSWVNGRKEYSAKGRLDWTPTDTFSGFIEGHYNRLNSTCCTWAPIFIDSSATFRGRAGLTGSVIYPGVTVDRNNNETRLDAPVLYNSRGKGGSVHLNYDLGGPSLMSITSYERFYAHDKQDQDNSDYDAVGLATNGAQHGSVVSDGVTRFQQVTQEVRLVSPNEGDLKYVLGVYYSHMTNSRRYVRGPGFSLSDYIYHTGGNVYALFGQTEWNFLPRFSLITGLRYNHQKVWGSIDNFRTNTAFPLPGTKGSSTDGAFTGKASLQFHPDDAVMLYASYARGYKGEGYDLGNSTNAVIYARQPVKAETADAYEIGAKTTLFDRRLILNVAGFWTDFVNFQSQQVEPGLGGSFVIANVGKLRTRGIEVDSQLRLGGLTLGAGATYLDAVIQSFPNSDCYTGQTAATGCVTVIDSTGGTRQIQDLAGKRLNNAPKWKVNLDANYVTPVLGGDWEGVLGASFVYTSAIQYQIQNNPATVQSGYGLVNLRATLRRAGGEGLSVSAFVNNLLDKHYYTNLSPNPYFTGPTLTGYLPRDFSRYAGFKMSYSF